VSVPNSYIHFSVEHILVLSSKRLFEHILLYRIQQLCVKKLYMRLQILSVLNYNIIGFERSTSALNKKFKPVAVITLQLWYNPTQHTIQN
jgi:hypothetical protein